MSDKEFQTEVIQKLGTIEKDVASMKKGQAKLQQDVNGLRVDVSGVRGDILKIYQYLSQVLVDHENRILELEKTEFGPKREYS